MAAVIIVVVAGERGRAQGVEASRRAGANVHGWLAARRTAAWILSSFASVHIGCSEGASTLGTAESGGDVSETDPALDTETTEASESGNASSTTGTSASTVSDGGPSDESGSLTDSGEGGMLCGNASVDPGEDCDDGNDVVADGCNPDCVESGRLLWSHLHAAGLGDTEVFRGVSVDGVGHVIAIGSVPGTMGRDIFVRQYEAQGALAWTTTIDGPAASEDEGFSVASGEDGSFVAGTTRNAQANDDGWLARLDPEGRVVWSLAADSALGFDGFRGVARTPDGGAVVAGYVTVVELMDMDQTIYGLDVIVRKYDASGGIVWTQTFGGAALGNDAAEAVAVDTAGNVVAIGWETVAGGTRDIWLGKFDPSGNPVWTRTQAGNAGLDDQGFGVAVESDGMVVAVGYEGVDADRNQWWARAYDAAGNELWTDRDLGVTLEGMQARGVAFDPAGDVVVTGLMGAGTGDRLVVRKYASGGERRWTRDVDGATGTRQVGQGVVTDGDAGVYVVGGRDIGVDARDAWIGSFAP